MSDEAIAQLVDYVGEVSGGWEDAKDQIDSIDSLASDIQTEMEQLKSDLDDKVDRVVETLQECAADIPSDEANWDWVQEQVDERLEELKGEWEQTHSDLIDGLKSDLLAEHALFAGLCADGYKAADFTELVERIFANVS